MLLKELAHSNLDEKVFITTIKMYLEKERKITIENGTKFKYLINYYFFMEGSAKTEVNPQNLFVQEAKMLYEDYLK